MGLTRTDRMGRFHVVTTPAPTERPDSPVRRLRKARGLTQEQLAASVGCDQTHLSDIELGRANPSLRLAQGIAAELSSTLDELFGEAVTS